MRHIGFFLIQTFIFSLNSVMPSYGYEFILNPYFNLLPDETVSDNYPNHQNDLDKTIININFDLIGHYHNRQNYYLNSCFASHCVDYQNTGFGINFKINFYD